MKRRKLLRVVGRCGGLWLLRKVVEAAEEEEEAEAHNAKTSEWLLPSAAIVAEVGAPATFNMLEEARMAI